MVRLGITFQESCDIELGLVVPVKALIACELRQRTALSIVVVVAQDLADAAQQEGKGLVVSLISRVDMRVGVGLGTQLLGGLKSPYVRPPRPSIRRVVVA